MRKLLLLVFVLVVSGCRDSGMTQVATFESADLSNKVVVLLNKNDIRAKLTTLKDGYGVLVDDLQEMKARELLTYYNFYFEREDLNDLLESKFASLSKLETVKSNFLQSREIYNKLSIMPNILRVSVVVTGEGSKRISVLILSVSEISAQNKSNIERFLKGVLNEEDRLTISYFVQVV
ncbi:type III secretion protein [Vibrio parahaemolyticus]|uniref:Putative type III secretion system lipoprotein EprK n=7 Tax=Vibrio parahaemolyticus TaxID=670 RepID=Q87GE9_VIBPA|nr:type III secretion protein [Vibrio parahaemolyticus]EDM61479.1 VcsJ2 [Vibrio parahaemolyticus AQ3810]EFO35321.1 protein VcsJ2 [Vibrio parahaemolyticus Peru-466]EFO49983.1 protein VcsJ2 [Vibrio parahaemolyticus K5030]EVU10874.1 secretory of YscJ/FliF family protein [Vibrio parahaemolyticus V-223/04]AGB12619.1 T3SS2 lipoprotein precursor EprK-like protein [Vibrio parahaemolyticus BB22OP]